ncbi:MAG: hypothetical protein HY834_08810 [Devosia nanyangense]|uniref:Mur ligase central domain-containing protein n=1 Tax=Devosia nanyangense TaxID=1228055 RepID=A0A933L2D5_9HYPH|nr:hypothetical protein [Devosia nanyangense]
MKQVSGITRLLRSLRAGGHELAYRLAGPIERSIARRNQARYCKSFVAVTGSVGKSTTTSLTGRLLGLEARAVTGLYQNTPRQTMRPLRKLDAPADFVVQEVSGHRPGALDDIVATLRVDIAVVTTIGLDHHAAFRTDAAVAAEKGKLVAALGPSGIACLNADDPLVRAMASRCRGRVVLYGRDPAAEVRAENVTAHWPERLRFDLVVGGRRIPVATRFVSTLMLTNLLAALAVVHAAGHDLGRAVEALRQIEPLPDRLGVRTGFDQHGYVVDTYKASYWSTRRLMEDLPNWGAAPRIVVLGDLSDVGNDGSRKYRQTLKAAAKSADLVIGVGHSAGPAARLRAAGSSNIVSAGSLDEVRVMLAAAPPSLVLLKSNRLYPLRQLVPRQTPVAAG